MICSPLDSWIAQGKHRRYCEPMWAKIFFESLRCRLWVVCGESYQEVVEVTGHATCSCKQQFPQPSIAIGGFLVSLQPLHLDHSCVVRGRNNISKSKCAWQAQFLRHILVILNTSFLRNAGLLNSLPRSNFFSTEVTFLSSSLKIGGQIPPLPPALEPLLPSFLKRRFRISSSCEKFCMYYIFSGCNWICN